MWWKTYAIGSTLSASAMGGYIIYHKYLKSSVSQYISKCMWQTIGYANKVKQIVKNVYNEKDAYAIKRVLVINDSKKVDITERFSGFLESQRQLITEDDSLGIQSPMRKNYRFIIKYFCPWNIYSWSATIEDVKNIIRTIDKSLYEPLPSYNEMKIPFGITSLPKLSGGDLRAQTQFNEAMLKMWKDMYPDEYNNIYAKKDEHGDVCGIDDSIGKFEPASVVSAYRMVPCEDTCEDTSRENNPFEQFQLDREKKKTKQIPELKHGLLDFPPTELEHEYIIPKYPRIEIQYTFQHRNYSLVWQLDTNQEKMVRYPPISRYYDSVTNIIDAYTDNGNGSFETIQEYMGPNCNFHGMRVYPKWICDMCKGMTFISSLGEKFYVHENQPIVFDSSTRVESTKREESREPPEEYQYIKNIIEIEKLWDNVDEFETQDTQDTQVKEILPLLDPHEM